jgi:hypothetical protein
MRPGVAKKKKKTPVLPVLQGSTGVFVMVPVVGLEPTRPFEQSILSAPRLPFRHTGSQHLDQNTVEF